MEIRKQLGKAGSGALSAVLTIAFGLIGSLAIGIALYLVGMLLALFELILKFVGDALAWLGRVGHDLLYWIGDLPHKIAGWLFAGGEAYFNRVFIMGFLVATGWIIHATWEGKIQKWLGFAACSGAAVLQVLAWVGVVPGLPDETRDIVVKAGAGVLILLWLLLRK